MLRSGNQAVIYFVYNQIGNEEAFHNGLIRVRAGINSRVNIVIINFMNDKSNNILSIDNRLAENSFVKYNIVDFGGKNSITNLYSNLEGDFSNNIINCIYLGKDDEKIDINYTGELYGKKTNIDIEVQGALKDRAVKHFKGTIDFKKGCKKAVGNENEGCMLLSSTAKSLALPMLLCSEEDVEGNHSSSSGKADDKELFYIMTRGFEKKEAEKLLVRAKFNSILQNITDEELKEKVLEEIDKRLD